MVEVAFMEELGLKWKRWLSNKRRKDGFVEKVRLFAEITVLAVVLDSWSSGLNQPPKDDMVMNKDFSDRRKKWLDDEVESLLTVDSEVEGTGDDLVVEEQFDPRRVEGRTHWWQRWRTWTEPEALVDVKT